jgi:hypothetical protein
MALSDIDLTLRAEEGVPLTAGQHDANMTAVENAVNATNAVVNLVDTNLATNGEMYQTDNAVATAVAVANTWYQVVNFLEGHTEGMTYSSSSFTIPTNGHYFFLVSLSFSGTTADFIQIAVGLNGVVEENHKAEAKLANNDIQAYSINGVINATAGQVFRLYIKNVAGTNNVTVKHATVNLIKRH